MVNNYNFSTPLKKYFMQIEAIQRQNAQLLEPLQKFRAQQEVFNRQIKPLQTALAQQAVFTQPIADSFNRTISNFTFPITDYQKSILNSAVASLSNISQMLSNINIRSFPPKCDDVLVDEIESLIETVVPDDIPEKASLLNQLREKLPFDRFIAIISILLSMLGILQTHIQSETDTLRKEKQTQAIISAIEDNNQKQSKIEESIERLLDAIEAINETKTTLD